uniref:DUF1127 domain-containing protein n=1 Tax=Klebsiella pneumoniae TaxID=573 RepID=UPI0013CFBC6F
MCLLFGRRIAHIVINQISKVSNVKIAERLKRAIAERRAIRELSVLDDRSLSDIGLVRGNIHSAVRA